eukprot:TRINITY_DN67135_c1_g3_i1.p1 TRINITY_DN67135_c1_g3~~TRINITY_DN67135_c1_g3_i1.p1  ORF type:complete len:186 (+),score=40.68 TRINITY_DN67135_c1_g3_i1:74-559(+)
MWVTFKAVNDKYRAQLRVLMSNLQNVAKEISNETIDCRTLAKMTSKQLQSEQLQLKRKRVAEEDAAAQVVADDDNVCEKCGKWKWIDNNRIRDEKMVWEPDNAEAFCLCRDTTTAEEKETTENTSAAGTAQSSSSSSSSSSQPTREEPSNKKARGKSPQRD